MEVIAELNGNGNGLLVRTSKSTLESFDRRRIVDSLIQEAELDEGVARDIALETELELRRLKVNYVTAPLVREMVTVKLLERGLEVQRSRYTRLGMPVYDVKQLIEKGNKENANLQFNPETVHKLMADHMMREYALMNILPRSIADAHLKAEIHVHDLDYFIRPFCFSHDIRFFLRTGFKADGIGDHTAVAGPAKKAEVAFLHATKVLAAAQTNCAGGQGFSYFNTFMAPYIQGLPYKNVKQLCQMFIYEMSQMYVARGAQPVFSSIDCDMTVPEHLETVPAVLPGGVVKDGTTYSNFQDETETLFNAFVDVYMGGDYNGKLFNFPKFEVQLHPHDIKKGRNEDKLLKVSELAAKFGTPYYILNQPYMPKMACFQCCSYLMPLSDSSSADDIVNGTIRGGGLQVVTINLPQIAYKAGGDDVLFSEILLSTMEKAKQVHLIKNRLIHRNLENGLLPFMNQKVNETDRYLEPDRQSYIMGLVGMNEMAKAHTGYELHEDAGWKFALSVMAGMKANVKGFRDETGFNFALARTPAESCASRFAQIDMKRHKEKVVHNGEGDEAYYTNSFHVRPSADIPLWDKLRIEGAFHPLTDGGAMTHVFLGEENPSPEGIMELTKQIATKTAIQYFSYTKDLTVCRKCSTTTGGLLSECPKCGSADVDQWSRITGYYQNVRGWNKGKRRELLDRKRYGL